VAPPRPYWKGYLKLSLVSCPIALYAATSSSERVSFRQINRKTGNRLRQQLIDDVTREPVEPGEKGRGYEVAKNQYIFIEDDEIDAVAVESNHTIEIDRFVPRAEMDERYLDSPYYLVPDDRVGQEAFAVIRDAMRGKDMVALGRVVLAKRERVIMLQPWDKGFMGTTLRYAYEVRDTADLFSGIQDMKIAKDMLALAEHILETKAGEFDPENFHDRYEDAVVEMLRRKQAGMPAEIVGQGEEAEEEGRRPARNAAADRRERRRQGGRREAGGEGRAGEDRRAAKKSELVVAGFIYTERCRASRHLFLWCGDRCGTRRQQFDGS
jgi:DNA end-binding protein Ku